MRVFWEEWRAASRFSSVRVLPPALFCALLALLVTQFQPGALYIVLALTGLAGGVLSGTQRWNQVSARDWVGLEGTGALEYCLGKVAGLLLVVGAWTLCFLPALVLVSLVWGLPLVTGLQALVWMAAAALGGQALGQAVTWGSGEFLRLLGSILAFLWIALTIQLPGTQPFNPLWQIWTLFHDPGQPLDTGALAAVLAVVVGLWTLVIGLLRRSEGRR